MTYPRVIYETEDFLIIDKPSGWITNSSSTTSDQPVLQSWIYENLEFPTSKSDEYRSGIVHRLDKETSGILIVAKTASAFSDLQRQFKDRLITKTYIALSHGEIVPKEGIIEVSVGRLPWRKDRFGIIPGGRDSLTKYEVIKTLKSKEGRFSLVELFPKTGRTHQIRIHLKHINHPIVSDTNYAGRKTARNDRKWCPRLFLHAKAIEFVDPGTKEKVSFKSELPSDLSQVLKNHFTHH